MNTSCGISGTDETMVTYPLERTPAGEAEEAHRPPRGVGHLGTEINRTFPKERNKADIGNQYL
jgi:hypothetical protein